MKIKSVKLGKAFNGILGLVVTANNAEHIEICKQGHGVKIWPRRGHEHCAVLVPWSNVLSILTDELSPAEKKRRKGAKNAATSEPAGGGGGNGAPTRSAENR